MVFTVIFLAAVVALILMWCRQTDAFAAIERLDARLRALEKTPEPARSVLAPPPERRPQPSRPPVRTPELVVSPETRPQPGPTRAPEPEFVAPRERIPLTRLYEPLGARQDDAFGYMRAWLFGGNTMVRVGIVVLLFGVSFFLNFAIDRGWLPIEFRLILASLGGFALITAGWWLRESRRDYALVLQGGGIGIVYLTVFAAVNLYALIATGPGLALMVVLAALSSALAVLQNARGLAILATCAGFAAPLLVSNEGSHIALFSYYAALNVAIAAIAWFKEWRLLNILGFVFTFLISALWGQQYYQPEYFASTEPFLVGFFLLYVAIPALNATRRAASEAHQPDGLLLFVVPLVAFGLQAGLVRHFEYGLAFSALGAGLFYVGLATVLWRRVSEDARILPETFLAFGVAFGTLAIPLAVDGRGTAAAWALEGAGLVWVGLRQRRLLAGAAGVLLQWLAGASFINTPFPAAGSPVFNSVYIGAVLISLAGLFCGWYLYRHRALDERIAGVSGALLGWGLMWWFGAGFREIYIHIAQPHWLSAGLVFTTASSVVLTLLQKRLAWAHLKTPVLLQLPTMVLFALTAAGDQTHPFFRWGGAAWSIALVAHYWLQWRLESEWPDQVARYWHAGMMWLVVFLASREAAWVMNELAGMATVWPDVAWVLVPAAAIVVVPHLARTSAWPFARFADVYLTSLMPLVIFVVAWVLFATVHPGDPAPLPYVLLANPLELAQCLVLAILLRLPARTLSWVSERDRWLATAVLAFAVVNGIIARATHFYGGVAFDFDALWASARYQSAASITWTALGMAIMLAARSLAQRTVWFAGAGLLLAVVAKLFLVDLEGVGTIARIISFVVVGLLILLVGYLSPLPPRSEETEAAS